MTDAPDPCSPPLRDMVDLVLALRARADEINVSREAIDDRAGLARGYAAKLLADPPIRQIGPVSLFPLVGALGCSLVLVEDRVRRQETQLQFRPRDGLRAKGTKDSDARKARIIRFHAKKFAKMGGKALAAKLTPEQRSASARRAAKARWRRPRIVEIGDLQQKMITPAQPRSKRRRAPLPVKRNRKSQIARNPRADNRNSRHA